MKHGFLIVIIMIDCDRNLSIAEPFCNLVHRAEQQRLGVFFIWAEFALKISIKTSAVPNATFSIIRSS